MHIRSLGLTTELGLAATRSTITDRGDYLVVTTPDDPSYYHGNLLVFPAAPQVGEVAFWMRRFAEELGANREIRHITFLWDGTTGETGATAELRAAGFAIEEVQVLAASAVRAPASALDVRMLRADEMPRTAELAFAIGDRHDEKHRRFLQRRMAWQRDLVTRGSAIWWGAFDGEQLAGSLGTVQLGERARYQDVQVAATHRERGVASALLSASAAEAHARGATTLVIVAAHGSAASRVYERVGFSIVERTASACRYPAE